MGPISVGPIPSFAGKKKYQATKWRLSTEGLTQQNMIEWPFVSQKMSRQYLHYMALEIVKPVESLFYRFCHL